MKFLIVGLGNIGAEYEHTRHNIGFDIVDAFASRHTITFRSDRLADVAEGKIPRKSRSPNHGLRRHLISLPF